MSKLPLIESQSPITAFFASPKMPKLDGDSVTSVRQDSPKSPSSGDELNVEASTETVQVEKSMKRPHPDNQKTDQKQEIVLPEETTKTIPDKELTNGKVAEIKLKLTTRSTPAVLDLIKDMHPEWLAALETPVLSERFQKLANFVTAERALTTSVYPPADQVFSWSQLCPLSSVRVVILGQDPYHGPKQAHGLAFSVQRPVRPPPSLVNMFKEIRSELGPSVADWSPEHGDLTGWARQGVLLLNAVLTVRASNPNSHKDKGWEVLTDAVVRHLNKEKSNLVFMLWGAFAQKQGAGISKKRHLVLKSPHPSPLSAARGFFGCGHFFKANAYLKEHNLDPINWTQLD